MIFFSLLSDMVTPEEYDITAMSLFPYADSHLQYLMELMLAKTGEVKFRNQEL